MTGISEGKLKAKINPITTENGILKGRNICGNPRALRIFHFAQLPSHNVRLDRLGSDRSIGSIECGDRILMLAVAAEVHFN